MTFEDQYELGALLHAGRAMTFEATETSSRRKVFVHFFVAGQPDETDLLQQARSRIAEFEAGQFPNPFQLGERNGAPFVVTPADPEFQDLAGWLQEPTSKAAADSAQSAAARSDLERGRSEPSEFTLLFEGEEAGASTVNEPPRAEAVARDTPEPLDTPKVPANPDSPAPSSASSVQKPEPRAAGQGEFTKLFQTDQTAGKTSADEMSQSGEKGPEAEETRMARQTATETSEAGAPPEPTVRPRSTAAVKPGEFTELFGIESSSAQGAGDAPIVPAPPKEDRPPSSDSGVTGTTSTAPEKEPSFRTLGDILPEGPPAPWGRLSQPAEALPASPPTADSALVPSSETPGQRRPGSAEAPPTAERKPVERDPGIPNIHPPVLGQSPETPESRKTSPDSRRSDLTVFRKVLRPGEAPPPDQPSGAAASGPPPQSPQPSEREEPSHSQTTPAAPPRQEELGEFTQLFGSARPDPAFSGNPFGNPPPAAQSEKKAARPQSEPGEFTKLFGGGVPRHSSQEDPFAPEVSAHSAFDPLQGDPLEPLPTGGESSSRQGGEFTKLFGSGHRVVEEPSIPAGDHGFSSRSHAGERASTRIFENRAPTAPASQPLRGGEGDYTRIVKGGTLAAPPQPAPPPQPAAAAVEAPQVPEAKQPEEGKQTDSSRMTYLILALVFCALLVLALGIVLYFSSKSSEIPAGSVPATGPGQTDGTVTAPTVPGVSVYSPGISTPHATAPSVSSGSVHAPSVSSGSITAPSVSAPSVSAPSVSSPSVTTPSATVSSPSAVPSVVGASSRSDSGSNATPYLAFIIVLSVLLVFAVGAAVYFAVKRA